MARDAVELASVGHVLDLGHLVEHVRDLVERCDRGEERVVELRELLHGVEEVRQVAEERDEDPDRHLTVEHEPAAVAEHDCGRSRREEVDEREIEPAEDDGLHVRGAVRVAHVPEVRAGRLLTREGLENAHARDVLGERRRDRAEGLPDGAVGASGALAEPGGRKRHRGHDHHRRECEPPVEEEEDHRRADERQRVLDEGAHPVGHELVERLDVVRQPADDHAGAVALVEAQREALQVAEEMVAQVGEHALAGPAGEVRLRVREDDPGHAGSDERGHEPVELRRVPVLHLVDREADEVRRHERDGRRPQERQHGERRPQLVRPCEAVQRGEPPPRLRPRPVLDGRTPAARQVRSGLVHAHYATSSVNTRSSCPCS